MEMFKGLQVRQLGRNALEGIAGHLLGNSDKTTVARKKHTDKERTRSQEAYLSRQAVEAIPIKLEDDASETTRANAVSALT
jgi:hypothetical protein